MKIKIGPYIDWWGPYQIADLLQKVGVSEDTCYKIGEKMPDWVADVAQWIYDKRQRDVKIHIDKYDTWCMSTTLAHIIVPMLIQLRETTHGYPTEFCAEDQQYGPQGAFKGDGFDYPEDDEGAGEWNKAINKMIWAFEQLLEDDWEEQYQTGVADLQFVDSDYSDDTNQKYSTIIDGPKHTLVIDRDGIRKHYERMQEGFELFGKYYQNLWD